MPVSVARPLSRHVSSRVLACPRILALLSICTLHAIAQQPILETSGRTALGRTTISFESTYAGGGKFTLTQRRGQIVLLSFLQVLPDTAATVSRTQLEALRSMVTQYGNNGISVVLVDESAMKTGHTSRPDDLLNATYDWDLKQIPLVRDNDGSIAKLYSVKAVPNTFLISRDGTLLHHWEHLTLTAQLAKAIQDLIGGSMAGKTPVSPEASD